MEKGYIGWVVVYNILAFIFSGMLGLLFLEHGKLYNIFPEYWMVAIALTAIVYVIIKAIFALFFKSSFLRYLEMIEIQEK